MDFRSQLGNRDSEIAMLIEDTDTVPSKMNGKDVRLGTAYSNLARYLYVAYTIFFFSLKPAGLPTP